LLLQKATLVTCFHELMDQRGRGRERDGKALLTSSQPKRQGYVALAGARVAERDDGSIGAG
jgi:hypothetical protein